MCGIVGVAFLSAEGQSVTEETIRRMCARIKHRGPDDEGIYVGNGIGIGMRRLSIIDVAGGHQPISNEDGSIHIVFNGEIYNHLDHRCDLERKGHVYTTRSDTETILHLYEEYGERCVEYLNGMFAIAIWDNRNRTLFLARDRIGIKPLYYGQFDGAVIFGSEIKSILEYPGFPRRLNYKALVAYHTLLYVPHPYSIFRDIHKIPPAHVLTVRNGTIRLRRYWHVTGRRKEALKGSIEDCETEIKERLTKSVNKRLMSEVPLGAFLSGGVDSSTVVALMSRCLDRPLKGFTMDFEGGGDKYREVEYARKVADSCGIDHNVRTVKSPHLIDLIQKLCWHFDEPFADSSMIPTFLISQFAREQVTVVLSGDGGDELFGGYKNYRRNKLFEYFHRLPFALSHRLIPLIIDKFATLPFCKETIWHYRFREFNNLLLLSPAERYTELVSHFKKDFMPLLLPDDQSSSWHPFRDLYQPIWEEYKEEELWNRIFSLDFESYLPEDILTKVDRASMANSLEVRVPLLDHPFVEYVYSLPANLKLRGLQTKYILKRVAAKLVPPSVIYRRKQGFSIPINEWLRNELLEFCHDLLLGNSRHSSGLYSKSAIEKILRIHVKFERNLGQHIWALMIFELWHSIFMKETN